MNVSEFIQSCMQFIYCVLLICAILTGFTFIGAMEITAKHIFFLLAVALVTMIGNRIFVNDRRYMSLWCTMTFTGCSLFIITWLAGIPLQYYEVNTFIGFWCAVVNYMLFLTALVPNGNIGRCVKYIILLILISPVAFLWAHFAATGEWIQDHQFLSSLLQMGIVDGVLYIFNGTGFFYGTLLLAVWLGLSFAFSGGGRLIFERMTIGTIIGCMLFLLLNGALLYRTRENMVMSPIYKAYSIQYMQDNDDWKR